jgi:hypothetical protein
MATPDIVVLAPTRFERWALRRVPSVVHSGVGLRDWKGAADIAIVAGLAGALVDLEPGTIVVPERAETEDGYRLPCDEQLRVALGAAARECGYPLETGPVLSARAIVRGSGRNHWASRGFVASDMETAFLSGPGRVAAVRVILDTPRRELSADWLAPGGALRPRLWPEMAALALRAPLYMRRVARVLEMTLGALR